MKASDLFSREEIRSFTEASDVQGWISVITDATLIAGAFALVAWMPTWYAVVFAALLLGSRQLGLAVLTHECAHYSLFRTRKLNDLVGRIVGSLVWTDVVRYRTHHRRHHLHTGREADPDLGLVRPFPTSRGSLARKFLRDLSGWTAVRRVAGLIGMDLGFLRYTASTDIERLDSIPLGDRFRLGMRHLSPVLLTNGALLGLLAATGHPELYGLWLLAWFTTFSLVLRIRSIAEHACMERVDDSLRNTRTTEVGPLTRLFLAPHHVNYHLEHHLLMTVPHWQLPRVHGRLKALDVLSEANVAPNYATVLARVSTSPS